MSSGAPSTPRNLRSRSNVSTRRNRQNPEKEQTAASTPRAVTRRSSMDVVGNDWIASGPSPRLRSGRQYDRFIPNRQAMDMTTSQFNVARKRDQLEKSRGLGSNSDGGPSKHLSNVGATLSGDGTSSENAVEDAYGEVVARACGIELSQRVLAFGAEPPVGNHDNFGRPGNRSLKANTCVPATQRRRIATTPEQSVASPGLLDDFYCNVLDWSRENMLAIALNFESFMWNAETGEVEDLCRTKTGEPIASVRFSQDGHFVAIGLSTGEVQIWDATKAKRIRTMRGHKLRVGTLAWDRHVLSTGCRDGNIFHHDVRISKHKIAESLGHTAEVCGLAWREDGQVLASGGNDNLVNLWDPRAAAPRITRANHVAAVKALAWCPWQHNLLATGGGCNDRTINFWNVNNGALLSTIDADSQVTTLIWSRSHRELLSTHGFPNHEIAIWNYPALTKVIGIPAHDCRVICSALSPDGQMVATGAGDDQIKIWRVFDPIPKELKARRAGSIRSSGHGMQIR